MGFKRSAKSGDFKKALEVLSSKGGAVEGTPKSIMIALGYDGSWNELRSQIDARVVKTDLGRFAILKSDDILTTQTKQKSVDDIDINLFAVCASSYVLGLGDENDFENYTGKYEKLGELTEQLAAEIDSTIGGIYLPFKSEVDIEIYSLERSIFYSADGDGLFTVYGSSVLAHV